MKTKIILFDSHERLCNWKTDHHGTYLSRNYVYYGMTNMYVRGSTRVCLVAIESMSDMRKLYGLTIEAHDIVGPMTDALIKADEYLRSHTR